jgi:hypothetical protein
LYEDCKAMLGVLFVALRIGPDNRVFP